MIDEQRIEEWLALCARVRQMRTETYTAWMFMVGTSGTLEERIAIGRRALDGFVVGRGARTNYGITYLINDEGEAIR
jgi:hypothetical protein